MSLCSRLCLQAKVKGFMKRCGKRVGFYISLTASILIFPVYNLMSEVCESCNTVLDCAHGWEMAHFDCEVAAVQAFKKYFPNVDVKMCCFHVKQALHRRVCFFFNIFNLFINFKLQKLGLQTDYQNNRKVQAVVRRIGALQIFPEAHIWKALKTLRRFIKYQCEVTDSVRLRLLDLLKYYK